MQSNTIGTTIGYCGDARTQPDSETNSEPGFENTLAKASGATAYYYYYYYNYNYNYYYYYY